VKTGINRRQFHAALGWGAASITLNEFGLSRPARAEENFTLASTGATWGEGLRASFVDAPKFKENTRLQIERRGSQVFVHAWGACHLSECDWGEQRALIDENSAILLWDQGFVFRKMEIRLNKKTDLTADYLSVYTDDSGRKKHETVEMFSYRATNNPTASDSSAPSPAPHPADTAGSH
jgi:hypothetical protein